MKRATTSYTKDEGLDWAPGAGKTDLEVNGASLRESSLHLLDRISSVTIEEVEMTDTVLGEERACHRPVESSQRHVRYSLASNIKF